MYSQVGSLCNPYVLPVAVARAEAEGVDGLLLLGVIVVHLYIDHCRMNSRDLHKDP